MLVGIGESPSMQQPIHYPLDFGNMEIAFLLIHRTMIGQGKQTEDIEMETVWNNHRSHHLPTLLAWVIPQVYGIVFSQILVQTNAQGIVGDDDALVQSPYLCVYLRNGHLG